VEIGRWPFVVSWPPRTSCDSRLRRALASGLAAFVAAGSAWAQPSQEVEPPTEEAAEAAREEPAGEAADAEVETPAIEIQAPSAEVEEIIIRGEAGVLLLETDAPTSVTSFDAEDLEAMGVEDVGDIANFTPNVEIRTAGETTATFFIRGVGLSDFSANAAGAVAIYQDGVPMNSPALQLGQLFDVESVSVLRGPQSGGAGRNASAGAIRIRSRGPTFEYGGNLRASFGSILSNDAENAFTQDYEGAIEVPLLEDVLGTRLTFRLRDNDPYIENRCGGAPPIPPRDPQEPICGERLRFLGGQLIDQPIPGGLEELVGESKDWAARGMLRFAPTHIDMDWLLNAHGRRLDQDATYGQAIGTGANGSQFGSVTSTGYQEPDNATELAALEATGLSPQEAFDVLGKNLAENRPLDIGPFSGDYDREGRTTLDAWGISLSGDIVLDAVEITTITGFDEYDRFRDADQDFTPDILFESVQTDKAWQFAQELRFKGELDAYPLRWELGGNYLMEQLESQIDQQTDALSLVPELGQVLREYEQDLWSFAFYGHVDLDFWDDFTLEAGLRYNWERKDFRIGESRPKAPGIPPKTSEDSETWDAPTGTIALTYHFPGGAEAYWKYSRGFKAGHFNTNEVGAPPAAPEFIDSFEIGVKGQWWDGRLDLGGALFHYAYQDYQVFVFEDAPGRFPTLKIINANDARVIGAEADIVAQPLLDYVPEEFSNLNTTLRFGWLESEFLDFTGQETAVTTQGRPFPIVVDFSGNPLINAPKFKLSGALDWAFDLGRFGIITPRYDFSWTDDVAFDPTGGQGSVSPATGEPNKPDFAVGQPAFWLHNVRLGWRSSDGRLGLAAWCRNVADERYKTYAFDTSRFAKVVINFVGLPRTCGGDISLTW
jgi:iron complex outermembrane receptor protein